LLTNPIHFVKESAMRPKFMLLSCCILLALSFSGIHAQNWQWQYPALTGNPLNDIAFADSLVGCAVGDVGTILHTSDGGQNWQMISTGFADDLHVVVFTSAQRGWIAGGGGT
jgi:hypothetical protein